MEKSRDLYPYTCFHLNKCSYGSCGTHLRYDYINSLPVEVLLVILSLLPLKEMVKTSILSRRWLNLWVNTPVLDFNLRTPGFDNVIRSHFVDWVNRVLLKHKSPYLKQFRICCNLTNDHREDVDRWLEFALARKVEILELNFLYSTELVSPNVNNYVFPDSWFVSTSGKANVDGGKSRVFQCNLKFLRSLTLKNVNIAGETILFFLRNCPFLERLEIVGNRILVHLVISGPSLVLKHLKVKNCCGLKVLSISNFNLVSLDTSVKDVILQDLPMLVELSIYGYANDLRHTVSQNASCIRQLNSLELTEIRIEKVTEMLSILTQLTKLKRLVIHYYAIDDDSLLVLLNVIKSCKYLEEFVLELKWDSPKRLPRAMRKLERLTCERLKVFKFNGFYGRFSDFELLMHVAKSAPCLEKIIVGTSSVLLRLMNYPEDKNEKEARRIALKHIKRLQETKGIPPHIDVLIC